jgi:hypothetical protein
MGPITEEMFSYASTDLERRTLAFQYWLVEKPSIGTLFVMLIVFRTWEFRPDIADANFMTVFGDNALLIFLWLAPSVDISSKEDWGLRMNEYEDFCAVVDFMVALLSVDLAPYLLIFPYLIIGWMIFENLGCEGVKFLPLQISDHLKDQGKMVELLFKKEKEKPNKVEQHKGEGEEGEGKEGEGESEGGPALHKAAVNAMANVAEMSSMFYEAKRNSRLRLKYRV